jgi:hypothetical protein
VKNLYQELVERFRGEVSDMEAVVQRALLAWSHSQKLSSERDFFLDSVALNLHGFYSGTERIFEFLARHLDQNLPNDETWHRNLLWQMTQEIDDVRPALISEESARGLDEFRRFRHLVRNVYTTSLVPDKLAGLMESLPVLWNKLKEELLAFADFLQEMAIAIDPDEKGC